MSFDIQYLKKGILRVVNVHLLSIIISAIMTLFVPKFLSTYDYGLWQLYLLYVGYIGFFHFGWLDGLYLRHAGTEYSNLDKKELKLELYLFIVLQFIISLIFVAFSFLNTNFDKKIIFIFVSLALLFVNVKFYFIYILQATGKIKEFSNIMFLQSFIQCILFFIINLLIKSYLSIIYADILSNVITLICSIIYCNDIILSRISKTAYCDVLNDAKKEIFQNVSSGSKLMIANILSLFTTGIIRIGIEQKYGVENFGIVSLALTFSALCINIFNSIGVVFVPLIKNKSKNVSKTLYDNLHILIDALIFFIMIYYYPVKVIFSKLMPSYLLSFEYLAITFPIMYFGCIQTLLHVTYLKSFRKEKSIFVSNLLILLFSILITFFGTRYCNNLEIMVMAIVVVYIVRNIIYEYFINKCINTDKMMVYMTQSLFIPLVYAISNYYIKGYLGLLLYLLVYLLWFIINKNSIFKLKAKLTNNL